MKEDTLNAMIEFIEATKAAIDESSSISDRAKRRITCAAYEAIGLIENEELPRSKD